MKYSQIRTKASQELKAKLVKQLGGKCVDCNQMPHIVAMDFDHIDPKLKKYNVARLIQAASTGEPVWVERLNEEILKCVLRCSNCHRIKTHQCKEIAKYRKNGHSKRFLFQ